MTLFLAGVTLLPGSVASDAEEEFGKALALYKNKEYAEALRAFQKLEKTEPADSLLMQGHALRSLERWPEAAQAFARAAEKHPLLADYALFSQGEAWQKAVETAPDIEKQPLPSLRLAVALR